MIRIDLQNMQAISDATIDIPENSITEFSGDNSNGKSIVSKIIQALTSGDIRNKAVRRSLIKDTTDSGYMSITWGKKQLVVVITEEQAQSYLIYLSDNENKDTLITRQISDKEGCAALINEFGFRTYANGDICLQLSPTWGPIPFVTTAGSVNYDIVNDITVDRIAQEFLDSFKTITYPTFRNRLQNIKAEQESVEAVLDAMEQYDWRTYKSLAEELNEYLKVINNYSFIIVDCISMPKYVKLHDIVECKLHCIPKPKLYEPLPLVSEIPSFHDVCEIRKGICPTCGRRFDDAHTC